MQDRSATTSTFIDKWHPKKDGTCAITIRVTYNRQKRYYPTEHYLTPKDFDKTQGDKPRGEFKNVSMILQAYEKRAADIIEDMAIFTFEAFEKKYYTNLGAHSTLKQYFERRIQDYKDAGRIGSATTYKAAKVSLERFQPGVKFAHVVPSFLESYESWMLNQGNSKTTVGIYLRSLRSLFNDAIADGDLSKEQYPFGRRKYEIPTGKNVKKALSLEEVARIYNYEAKPGSPEESARDYWMFLYYCNGMNVKDMALLKYKNMKKDIIEFERAKTARTKREYEPIRVILNEESKAIIKYYGNQYKSPETYLFPILKQGMSPQEIQDQVGLKVHVINEHIKAIAVKVGIEKKVTTYVARHSYATILRRSGIKEELIGETMGHTSPDTTRKYFASLEEEYQREAVKALTAFKHNGGKRKSSKIKN